MKNIFFIYNPNAGKGKIKDKLPDILKVFDEAGFEVTPYETKGPKDATNQVIENAFNYDRVVCAGGDGTLSEVVAGMMQLPKEKRVPIGFIPIGSTNDTSKSYHLPMEVTESAKIAVCGKKFATDIGIFNRTQYITYVSSFGNLSAVSCFTPQELKKKFGYAAYLKEGIKVLLQLDSYEMKIEYEDKGETKELSGIFYLGMATNTLSVGGFKDITGAKVLLDDGLYEVAVLNRPKNLVGFAKQVNTMLIKKDKNLSNELVHKFKTKRIKFSSKEDLQWVIDGEDAGKYKEVEIEVEQGAVEIFIQ